MKIKFIKDFKYPEVDISAGAVRNSEEYHFKDEVEEWFRWLIDNGFAKEVQESSWWKPKNGVDYYYVRDDGVIVSRDGFLSMSTTDDKRVDIGNAFRSKKATEAWRDYLKANATVRQDEGVIDLQGIGEEYEAEDNKYDDFCVYTVAFDLYLRKLVVTDADEYISANAIWFEDKEYAQDSLDKHPDEWQIIASYDWSRE